MIELLAFHCIESDQPGDMALLYYNIALLSIFEITLVARHEFMFFASRKQWNMINMTHDVLWKKYMVQKWGLSMSTVSNPKVIRAFAVYSSIWVISCTSIFP